MKAIMIEGLRLPQFESCDLNPPLYSGHTWSFCSAMVGLCRPIFDECFGNCEVEDVLRKAKVIRANNKTDSETCQMWVYFSKKESGEKFIERLNKYIDQRARKIREGDRY